jgi:predicted permease
MGTWLRRLAYLLRQSRHEAELREEIEAHRALRAVHLERDGLTSQEADDASRRSIGNVLLAREDAREVWLGSWDQWWQDVRHGLRTFRMNPTFAAAAVVTMALGIGVNTGIFSVLNAVTLRDLPAADADQLVSIHQIVKGRALTTRSRSEGENTFSTSEYRTYRDRTRTLTGIMGYSPPRTVTLGGETLREITGAFVTCNYFDVLRQPLALGPGFTARHCEPGASPAIVLGHDVWSTAFGADRGIIGRDVLVNRRAFTVVGVAPEGVRGVDMVLASYFAPIAMQPFVSPDFDWYSEDAATWLTLIGRKSDETSLEQVRAELGSVAAQIDRQQPPRVSRLIVDRARYNSKPDDRQETLAVGAVLMTAFGLVLLIACANVANLLLARAIGHRREIVVRFALGAGRARIVRQLLTESVLIALVGGALGSVMVMWSVQGLVVLALSTLPAQLPALAIDASPDFRVLVFALIASLVTGVACGLAPAIQASRRDLHTTLKQDAPAAGGHRSHTRLQSVLLGVQVSVCMVLMIAAGLLLRGLQAAQTVEPGFDYADVASVSFDLTGAGYDAERAIVFNRQLMDWSRSLPGVRSVAQALFTPLYPATMQISVGMPGQAQYTPIPINVVSPDYFSLVGIPIVRGRGFVDADLADGATAVIVTEATARRYWPDRNPLGQTIAWNSGTPDGDIRPFSFQVVGVAKDAQLRDIGEIPSSYLYLPAVPLWQPRLQLLVSGRTELAALEKGIRAAASDLDPALLVRIAPLEANLELWRKLGRLVSTLSTSLGALAIALAAVGIFGVVSYFVGQRLREIGIRITLGASASDVLALILQRTMRPVVVGAVIGVVSAAAVSRMLTRVLFGVSPVDPIGLGGASLFVMAVALAAGVLAARPAMRSDPLVALRHE